MKRFCIIFFLLFGIAYSVQAQDITGKWKCSKELLGRLQLRYDNIKGYYVFKKNGKFILMIKGTKTIIKNYGGINLRTNKFYTRHSTYRPLSIKVSGKYEVKDGKVSAYVKLKDVKVNVGISARTPRIPDADTNDFDYSMIQFYNKLYDSDSSQADIQANMIRAEKWFMWSWRDLSVRQTADSLIIGKIIKLTKM